MNSKLAIGRCFTSDFLCLRCGYPSYFGERHCKKCGQEFPSGHGAVYVPFKDWPKYKEK